MTIQEHPEEGSLSHMMTVFIQQIRARSSAGDSLAFDPLYIPALIQPLQTPGADGGLNYAALHSNASGLLVIIQQYSNMRVGDWIEVFWGDDEVSVASAAVLDGQVGVNFPLFIEAIKVLEGLHQVHYTVTHAGSGNEESSLPLSVLVRRDQPGGIDPEPDQPNHQNLAPPEPELPSSGIIDEEAARNGIQVTIQPYPNMREYDRITLSWGGELVYRNVTPEEVGQAIEMIVPEEVILRAGDSQALVLIYRVRDEVHNVSSDWSIRTFVDVEVDISRPVAPQVVNPDSTADPYDVIDLDTLGDSDLTVNVMVMPGTGIARGDSIVLEWIGTTSQGQKVTFGSAPQSLPQVPWALTFAVPNDKVRGLGRGSGMASYTVTLADASELISRRAFVAFLGVEQQLPKPTVSEAVEGTLDPDLAEATVVVPGEALEEADWVVITWLGTQADGKPLLESYRRQVSSGGGGKPLYVRVPGDRIKPLAGGVLEIHYELYRVSMDTPLVSEREYLQLGESQQPLSAPSVDPAASDGWLDPGNLPNGVTVVVAPYANMRAGQTVHMEWRATVGGDVVDYREIVPSSTGKPVEFPITLEQLRENADGEVEVWYRVEEPGQPTRRSESLHLKIVKEREEEAPLPAPVVLEAEDGVLDPLQGATVRVAYDDMASGDIVAISWSGESAEGSYESPQQPGSALKYLDFSIPADVLRANEGQTVTVYFARVRNGGALLSPPLSLSVSEVPIGDLPTPVIPQAVSGQLDALGLTGDARVTVQPWPLIRAGQHYWLRAHGKQKSGAAYTIDLAIGETISVAQVSNGLDIPLTKSELLKLLNQSDLQVELKVALKGGQSEADAIVFPLLTVSVRTEKRFLVETFAGVPLGTFSGSGQWPRGFETPVMTVRVLVGTYLIHPKGGGCSLEGVSELDWEPLHIRECSIHA